MGVQLEISSGLRKELFPDRLRRPQKSKTVRFKQFVHAMRNALSKYTVNPDDEKQCNIKEF